MSTFIASAANGRENLMVNSINREPARAYSVPLASEKVAFTDAIEPESPCRKSLNCTWNVSRAGNPGLRQLGIGGASCGPKPMGKYMLPASREEWTLRMESYAGEPSSK